MKITQLKTYLVPRSDRARRAYVFVKVETDEGLHGWGEATLEVKERTVMQAIHDLSIHVVGEDPTRIEYLWQLMRRHGFWRGGVVTNTALSAIEQALWDITGKAWGLPVYKLLGGACRDRIRCYAHAGPANAAEKVAEGFQGIKTGVGGLRDGRFHEEHLVDDAVDHMTKMRAAIGDSVALMVDCHGRLRPSLAVRLIHALSPFHLFFLEEPVPPDNVDAYRKIAQCGAAMDIATGERLFTRWGFRELIERQYVDVVQPDVCHCGGILELRKIAAAAETYHMTVAPHNPNGPVSTAASAQVAAVLPNFNILEYACAPVGIEIQTEPAVRPVHGFIELTDRPGLGIDLDEDKVRALHESCMDEFQPIEYGPCFDPDGAPSDV